MYFLINLIVHKLNKCLIILISATIYSKRITLVDVFFLAPTAVVSLRQNKYIAKTVLS